MQAPAPGQRPGMPPAGGAAAPGGMPMQPVLPHQVLAMQPRPYPNPMQMSNPVGLAAVQRQQMMMQQQAAAQQAAPAPKGKGGKAAPEKTEPPAA